MVRATAASFARGVHAQHPDEIADDRQDRASTLIQLTLKKA
jgi:hypothetical protein